MTEEYSEDMIIQFMCEFINILAAGEQQISETNYNKLKDVFKISSSTSTTQVATKKGTAVLEDDIVVERQLGATDVKYKIICAPSKMHIGFGERIRFTCDGREYSAKMHNTSKGRIDGLSAFYNDLALQVGDKVRLTYKFSEKQVICEIIDK